MVEDDAEEPHGREGQRVSDDEGGGHDHVDNELRASGRETEDGGAIAENTATGHGTKNAETKNTAAVPSLTDRAYSPTAMDHSPLAAWASIGVA